MNSRKTWSREDLQYLLDAVRRGDDLQIVATILNRTIYAVRHKVDGIGYAREILKKFGLDKVPDRMILTFLRKDNMSLKDRAEHPNLRDYVEAVFRDAGEDTEYVKNLLGKGVLQHDQNF